MAEKAETVTGRSHFKLVYATGKSTVSSNIFIMKHGCLSIAEMANVKSPQTQSYQALPEEGCSASLSQCI